MQKVITIIALIAITSCAAVSFNTKEQVDTKYIVQKCFDAELIKCSDVICEMDLSNHYEIIEQLKINVLACVEESEK
jgi:hypothetical protein